MDNRGSTSRQWWSQFTPEERSEIMRQRSIVRERHRLEEMRAKANATALRLERKREYNRVYRMKFRQADSDKAKSDFVKAAATPTPTVVREVVNVPVVSYRMSTAQRLALWGMSSTTIGLGAWVFLHVVRR